MVFFFFSRIVKMQRRSIQAPGCRSSRSSCTLLSRCARAEMSKDCTRRLALAKSKVCVARFTFGPRLQSNSLPSLEWSLWNGVVHCLVKNKPPKWHPSCHGLRICCQVSLGSTQNTSVPRARSWCWRPVSSQWTNASNKYWSCSGMRWV